MSDVQGITVTKFIPPEVQRELDAENRRVQAELAKIAADKAKQEAEIQKAIEAQTKQQVVAVPNEAPPAPILSQAEVEVAMQDNEFSLERSILATEVVANLPKTQGLGAAGSTVDSKPTDLGSMPRGSAIPAESWQDYRLPVSKA
jgi:hypothetical protein